MNRRGCYWRSHNGNDQSEKIKVFFIFISLVVIAENRKYALNRKSGVSGISRRDADGTTTLSPPPPREISRNKCFLPNHGQNLCFFLTLRKAIPAHHNLLSSQNKILHTQLFFEDQN